MTPSPYIFADIFDSPWVILMVLLGGPLINWLTKRREEAKAAQPEADEKAGTADEKAALAELLRQLMGEPPAKAPVPPPLPVWEDEEGDVAAPANRRTGPPVPPSNRGTVQAINRERELAKLRLKQLKEESRHLAEGKEFSQGHRTAKRKGAASFWRNRKQARQAFVASLVFAPPKGLEMDR